MTIRDIGILLGYDIDENSEQAAENSIKSLKSMATKMLGAIGIGFSLAQLNALSEEFGRVNTQIRTATAGLEEQSEVQQKILASANATRTSYADAANVISKLMSENSELFGSVDEAVKFNDAATMLFKTAGKTNDQIAGLMEAINKSFAKGRVDSETISQLLEQSPEAVVLLNKRLGSTTDQLEQLATDGKITLADLKGVFVDNADTIAQSFGDVRYNVTDALTNIRNQWGLWVADMDESLGVSQALGTTMVKAFSTGMDVLRKLQTRIEWLAEKLGGTEKLFKLIGLIAGAAFGVMALPRLLAFLDGLRKMDRAMAGMKLKILAIVAVIVVLALLVEDFFAFMRGDSSLIGSLFDKAGIGADNARQAILNAWGAIKDFLLKAWELIRNAAMTIFGALSEWWAENGEAVKASFLKIWEAIKTLCITLWNALSSAAKSIFKALKAFWDTWGSTIISVFGIIWNTLISLIQPFLDYIAGIINFLSSVFTGDWEGAWNAIKDIAAAIWQMITTIVSGAWDVICAIWSKLAEIFGGIFQAAWDIITEKVSGIKDAIVNGFTAAIDWIKGLPGEALQWGADIIDAIVSGITGAVGKVGEAVKGVADKIKSFLGFSEPEDGPLSDFHTYMPDMIDLMTQGIQAGKDKVKDAVGNLAQGMSVGVNADIVPNMAGSVPDMPTIVPNMPDIGGLLMNGIVAGKAKLTEFLKPLADGLSIPIKAEAPANNEEQPKGEPEPEPNKQPSPPAPPKYPKPAPPEPPKSPQGGGAIRVSDVLDVAVKGLASGIGKAKVFLNSAMGDMNTIAKAKVVSPSTAASVGGGDRISKSVVQNVNIQNQFNGDRAGQKKSSEAMDKATEDSTSELARALAFTR